MKEQIISLIAETLKEKLPSIPMNLATRYATFIFAALDDAGWIKPSRETRENQKFLDDLVARHGTEEKQNANTIS